MFYDALGRRETFHQLGVISTNLIRGDLAGLR